MCHKKEKQYGNVDSELGPVSSQPKAVVFLTIRQTVYIDDDSGVKASLF